MGRNVWIGTRGAERWFRAPAPRASFQPVGWSQVTQGRNGRATGRVSRATHMVYELNWNTLPIAEARKVNDWYYGVDGEGLVHWLDPSLKNALPAHWSMPGMGATDGPPIYGHVRPTAVATAANAKGLPVTSGLYTAVSSYTAPRCYIPIPPGYAAHIGVHQGDAAAADSIVVAQSAGTSTVTRLPGIAPSSSVLYNTVITRSTSSAITGVEIRLAPGQSIGGTTLPSTGVLAGIMVEVLPIGTSPQGSGFVRGAGNSGCRMFEPATEVLISTEHDRMSTAATLVEVGP